MSVASNMKNAAAKLLAATMAAVLALGIANVNKYSDSFSKTQASIPTIWI